MRKWKSGWCAPMMMMCTIRVARLMQSINQIDVWSGLSRDLKFDDIHFEFAFVQIIYVWNVAIQKSSKLITWHWIAGLEDDQKRPSDICITNFRLAELFSARFVYSVSLLVGFEKEHQNPITNAPKSAEMMLEFKATVLSNVWLACVKTLAFDIFTLMNSGCVCCDNETFGS